MADNPFKFWKELKRRKVVRVIIGYLAASYVILELTTMLAEPFGLPEGSIKLVFVLLCIGFIIAIYFSWVFDITSKGIKKTESAKVIQLKQTDLKPEKWKLKVSNIIIILLVVVVIVLAYPRIFKRNTIEKLRSSGERISVAVMPFQNMTNDTIWNIWKQGIQDILITSLSGSEELKVRNAEAINGMIRNEGLTDYASITPALASTISKRMDADFFIYGNIKQAGSIIRMNAKLIDTETEEVYKSFQLEGTYKEEIIFRIIDSLSVQVRNFILVDQMREQVSLTYDQHLPTNSPEAYRYYIYGVKAISNRDLETTSNMLGKAIAVDSNFVWASYMLAYSYYRWGLYPQAKELTLKLNEKKNELPHNQKLWVNYLYAILFGTPHERITYLSQLEESNDQSLDIYLHLGLSYRLLGQYDKAIPPLEKALQIYNRWGLKPELIDYYQALGLAYHETGKYRKEKKLYKEAEKDFPDNSVLISQQMILLIASGETDAADGYLERYISLRKRTYDDSNVMRMLGRIYSDGGALNRAEEYFRKALYLADSLEKPNRMNNLAWFLINSERNNDEGMIIIDRALELQPDNYNFLDTKGWGLYKQEKYLQALALIERSWELKPIYSHTIYLHLEAAKEAIANQ